ncbi:hypothetical protein IP92_04764 [Pseudoduganella flava]|uniref:Sigma-70 family RNA polymerase sigma factor n=1 Tax=Pseudoduganella flava TaxID=871742 RepID=A0A562PGZ9_9BURK|nr:hypothetical protein [Pseudoduganella flava]QGZ42560.1 hypothetical protein GO485_28350 [Pseudoduganella flava]TWI43711.1 hypothetical protein IP92_04764 [Pseudoduganella flava]
MRLPGTRYQEPGWEQVRKLLGHVSLVAFRQCDLAQLGDAAQHAPMLDWYTDALAHALRGASQSLRGAAPGNSYGDSVGDLALGLVFELQAQPAYFAAFAAAVAGEHAKAGPFWQHTTGDALLRKKVNDMYATLRDKVDADNYVAATGQPCTPNRIYTYRMLDMAHAAIAQVFNGWPGTAPQVAAILGRPADGFPIEVRRLKGAATCKAEWVINWSATLEQFTGAPGPLHTKSKRFASLRNSPEKIGAMLAEIGDYEELSANLDGDDWRHDQEDAAAWLDDLARVSLEARAGEADRILPPPEDEADETDELCAAPGYDVLPGSASALAALRDEALPVRLAVFLKLLGPADDSYPDEWLDRDTGELPTLQRLAQQGGMSVPTLRKRRNAAIARLYGARPTGDDDEP